MSCASQDFYFLKCDSVANAVCKSHFGPCISGDVQPCIVRFCIFFMHDALARENQFRDAPRKDFDPSSEFHRCRAKSGLYLNKKISVNTAHITLDTVSLRGLKVCFKGRVQGSGRGPVDPGVNPSKETLWSLGTACYTRTRTLSHHSHAQQE